MNFETMLNAVGLLGLAQPRQGLEVTGKPCDFNVIEGRWSNVRALHQAIRAEYGFIF
jgi:hypothetical protein